jgi:hypothetical protein
MIRTSVTTQRRDTGLRRFQQRMQSLAQGEKAVTVGVHSDAGGGYEGGASVLDVATMAEFGIGQPQRSFVRAWAEEHKDDANASIRRIAQGVVAGKLDERSALEQLGLWAVGSMQARISAGIEPPNAPSTIAKKGSSTPLIDKGQLRSSITHKVDG